MGIVTGQSSVWQDAIAAWAACGPSVEDLPDPVSELHAAALLRQHLASAAILATTLVVCAAAVLNDPPSPASATLAIVVSMMLGYGAKRSTPVSGSPPSIIRCSSQSM